MFFDVRAAQRQGHRLVLFLAEPHGQGKVGNVEPAEVAVVVVVRLGPVGREHRVNRLFRGVNRLYRGIHR